MADAVTNDDYLSSLVGKPTTRARVVVERGSVGRFAEAIRSTSPIYRNPEAAQEAGFDAIQTPPTWPFVMEFAGTFEEIQPEGASDGRTPLSVMEPLMTEESLILHGEQEFIYHRPVRVGDVLVGEGRITDVYQKVSKGKTMTFVVSETNWRDDSSGEPVTTVRINFIHRA